MVVIEFDTQIKKYMNQARSVVHEFSNCYFPMVLALFKVFFVFL